ncbi:MAG: transcription termination factor NusA [candidate division Zixibacteria bacterium]|nr:transcription termination factor NusA [candidate division Zixibacteria bacterium]MBU1469957.1 transcription termination factor NusA [candidate division Zixibacteria bacterium]MBU2626070.1 transcription termination factor NusA [candidate division Zixibacteria bacterium]
MSYDILEAMTQIAREKNLDLQYVIETLESSLLSAAKKKFANADNIFVKVDPSSGEINIHALKTVVSNVTDPNLEISLEEATEIDDSAEEGDEVEVYIGFEEFGRNAIATAKQLMIQKVREAEREMVFEEYSKKIGELVTGSVQQIDKGDLIINLGRAEAILPSDQQIPREKYRQGDRVRAFIADVKRNQRGPQVVLSRTHDGLIRKLFELEVPEIFERIIEIKEIAREPGERAKIAVASADERIDPVGACVGIKGVRVQSIVRELSNERIDIIQYHPDPVIFVTRALSPATVVKIDTYPEDGSMTVVVEDDKLSLAIGRQGQNARLAARLSGWRINILSESEYSEIKRREVESKVPISALPGITDHMTNKLLEEDILYVQDLAATSVDELLDIPGIGPKKAEALIELARQTLGDVQAKKELEFDEDVEEWEEDDDVDDSEDLSAIGKEADASADESSDNDDDDGDDESSKEDTELNDSEDETEEKDQPST